MVYESMRCEIMGWMELGEDVRARAVAEKVWEDGCQDSSPCCIAIHILRCARDESAKRDSGGAYGVEYAEDIGAEVNEHRERRGWS
jgi:hypothetical protein